MLIALAPGPCYVHLSLELRKTFVEEGPFDGIVGFSQGGCLAGLLAAMQPRDIAAFVMMDGGANPWATGCYGCD